LNPPGGRLVDTGHRGQDLGGNFLVQFDKLVEIRKQRTAQRFHFGRSVLGGTHSTGFSGEEFAVVGQRGQQRAMQPSTSTLTVPSGSLSICSTVATQPVS
jgi:hypothetical protein